MEEGTTDASTVRPGIATTSTTAGGGSSSTGTLSRKLQKVLELHTEEADLLGALHHLSGWYGPPHRPNSKPARRLLRSHLERHSLVANQSFLQAFALVQQARLSLHLLLLLHPIPRSSVT